MQSHKAMRKIIPMTRTGNDTKADDMSADTTIDAKAMEEEVDSLGIATYDRVNPPSASHVTKKVTSTQTVHTRTGLISNSVPTVEQGITC